MLEAEHLGRRKAQHSRACSTSSVRGAQRTAMQSVCMRAHLGPRAAADAQLVIVHWLPRRHVHKLHQQGGRHMSVRAPAPAALCCCHTTAAVRYCRRRTCCCVSTDVTTACSTRRFGHCSAVRSFSVTGVARHAQQAAAAVAAASAQGSSDGAARRDSRVHVCAACMLAPHCSCKQRKGRARGCWLTRDLFDRLGDADDRVHALAAARIKRRQQRQAAAAGARGSNLAAAAAAAGNLGALQHANSRCCQHAARAHSHRRTLSTVEADSSSTSSCGRSRHSSSVHTTPAMPPPITTCRIVELAGVLLLAAAARCCLLPPPALGRWLPPMPVLLPLLLAASAAAAHWRIAACCVKSKRRCRH